MKNHTKNLPRMGVPIFFIFFPYLLNTLYFCSPFGALELTHNSFVPNKEFCIENKYVNRKLKNGGWKFRATSAHSIYKYTYFYSITNFLFYRFRSHYVKINEKCKKGEIRWTLTKKYLNLSFQVSEKFFICPLFLFVFIFIQS
jgi:hypothetical protein